MTGWTMAGGGRAAPHDHVRSLDHVLTYLRAETLDEASARWRRGGFLVDDERSVASAPGIATGFIRFGHEYLELLAVTDDAAFRAASPAMPANPAVRAAARPFALAFDHDDAHFFTTSLVARGFDRPAPRWLPYPWDADHGIAILDEIVPGVAVFACSYANPKRQRPPVPSATCPIPPNRIRRWSGAVMVTASPHAQAEAWRRILCPTRPLVDDALGHGFDMPNGRLRWQIPAQWQGWTGRPPPAQRHRYDEIGLLLMESDDLALSAATVTAGGWQIEAADTDAFFIRPDFRDGVAMYVSRPQS